MRHSAIGFVLVIVIGCGDDVPRTASGGAGGTSGTGAAGIGGMGGGGTGGSGGAPVDVTGTAMTHYVWETGDATLPEDLSQTRIVAWVPPQAGATMWTEIDGTGNVDGTFRIPSVPPGRFVLQKDTDYMMTASTNLDLGRDVLGRPDVRTETSSAQLTEVDLELSNLDPWRGSMQIVSANAGVFWGYTQGLFTAGGMNDGATSGSATFDWAWSDTHHLIDAASGDQTILTQLLQKTATTSTGNCPYLALTRAVESTTLTVADQATTTFTASLAPVTQSGTLQVTIRQPASVSRLVGALIALSAEPKGLAPEFDPYWLAMFHDAPIATEGWGSKEVATRPHLLQMVSCSLDDFDTGPLSYGNPFPADWEPFLEVRHGFYAAGYELPGLTYMPVYAQIGTWAPLSSFTNTIQMKLGAVANPKVDGTDVTAAALNTSILRVGRTPTLSWDAPSIGTASGYEVYIFEVDSLQNSTATSGHVAGTLFTDQPSVSIPPGVLTYPFPAQAYFFIIRALHFDAVDLSRQLFRRPRICDFADAVTGMIGSQ